MCTIQDEPVATYVPTFELEDADTSSVHVRHLSLGHVADAQGILTPVELDTQDCPPVEPAGGGFYTTAGDMARFTQMLLTRGAPVLQARSAGSRSQVSLGA